MMVQNFARIRDIDAHLLPIRELLRRVPRQLVFYLMIIGYADAASPKFALACASPAYVLGRKHFGGRCASVYCIRHYRD